MEDLLGLAQFNLKQYLTDEVSPKNKLLIRKSDKEKI